MKYHRVKYCGVKSLSESHQGCRFSNSVVLLGVLPKKCSLKVYGLVFWDVFTLLTYAHNSEIHIDYINWQ